MSPAVVLVWLSTQSERAAHEPDLAGWADARLVRLEDPSADTDLDRPAPAYDAAVADAVERLLGEGRTAIYALDPSGAERSMLEAEQLLGDHPELPQAAWLLAEVSRIRAAAAADGDPGLARTLRARAAALDGDQAPDFTESARRGAPAPAPAPARGASGITRAAPDVAGGAPDVDAGVQATTPEARQSPVSLTGPLADDTVIVDGVSSPGPWLVSAGTHHVRVARHGRFVFAGWVAATGATTRVPLAEARPCTESDLQSVHVEGRNVIPGPVRCDVWAAARAIDATRIEVALCRRGACGPLLPWSRSWGKVFDGPAQPAWPRPASTAWIGWVVSGVVAATATTFVLYRVGAFDREGPGEKTYSLTWDPRPR